MLYLIIRVWFFRGRLRAFGGIRAGGLRLARAVFWARVGVSCLVVDLLLERGRISLLHRG